MRIILIAILVFPFVAFSQGSVEFKAGNFKDDKDGFKKASDDLKAGDEKFEEGWERIFLIHDPTAQFTAALKHFEFPQKFNPNNALLNFRIGVCMIHSSRKEQAIAYIEKAHELDPACDPFLPYFMGWANHLKGDAKTAKEFYEQFESGYKKADEFSKFVRRKMSEVRSLKQHMEDPARAWVDHLENVNTEYDELSPAITTDGEMIIFSSNRPNGHKEDPVTGFDFDMYVTSADGGDWSSPRPLPGDANTLVDDYVNNLSYDGRKLLLHREENGNADIYESERRGSKWASAVNFSENVNGKHDERWGAYNFNDKKIFFAKSQETTSRGADIYMSGVMERQARKYGRPAPVSSVLNTGFNDGPIYLHPDGETMYICSEGHNSMGGYDIFISKKVQGQWTEPQNLGYPINTPYDDFFFAATANGKYAYIASNRAGGNGGFDLYKVTFWGEPKLPELNTEDYLLASAAKPMQEAPVIQEIQVSRVSLTVFKGKTLDAISRKAVKATIEIFDNSNGQVIQSFESDGENGKFLITLNAGKNYGIAVKADGYLFHSENFDIPSNSDYNLVNKTIELKNIAVGSKIALRNIFFATGKSDLRPESNAELDRLVKLLKDVPKLKIEISGHTDNTGSASLNDKLSQDRADAVVKYLTGKGISKSRLTSKGYGSNRPVATNNTAEGRQSNRRTEFEILAN